MSFQEVEFSPKIDSDGRGWGSTLIEGELWIQGDRLLSAIWYSDGSGAHGVSSGIDTTPDEWRITNARLTQGFVVLSIERKGGLE